MEWETLAAKNVPPYLLEGAQAPGIVLPTDFCIQLLCLCCGQEAWRRKG